MLSKQQFIVEKGKDIFYRLKPRLEKQFQPGYYVTIEVTSGKFFVGKSPIEAINKAKGQFPRKQFFLAQVGKASGILKHFHDLTVGDSSIALNGAEIRRSGIMSLHLAILRSGISAKAD